MNKAISKLGSTKIRHETISQKQPRATDLRVIRPPSAELVRIRKQVYNLMVLQRRTLYHCKFQEVDTQT
jgi:hypothetical protein